MERARTLTGSVSFTMALPSLLCEVMSTWGPCRGESWFSVGARVLEDMMFDCWRLELQVRIPRDTENDLQLSMRKARALLLVRGWTVNKL